MNFIRKHVEFGVNQKVGFADFADLSLVRPDGSVIWKHRVKNLITDEGLGLLRNFGVDDVLRYLFVDTEPSPPHIEDMSSGHRPGSNGVTLTPFKELVWADTLCAEQVPPVNNALAPQPTPVQGWTANLTGRFDNDPGPGNSYWENQYRFVMNRSDCVNQWSGGAEFNATSPENLLGFGIARNIIAYQSFVHDCNPENPGTDMRFWDELRMQGLWCRGQFPEPFTFPEIEGESQLRVDYFIRIYPRTSVDEYEVNGVTLQTRAIRTDLGSRWYPRLWGGPAVFNSAAWVLETNVMPGLSETGGIAPGFAVADSGREIVDDGDFFVDQHLWWEPQTANFATGIGSFASMFTTANGPTYLTTFTPKIQKSNLDRLHIYVRNSWDRVIL